ncbi:hypothetical protein WJX77_005474 [Trebouxia sp. C0004]
MVTLYIGAPLLVTHFSAKPSAPLSHKGATDSNRRCKCRCSQQADFNKQDRECLKPAFSCFLCWQLVTFGVLLD